MDARVLLLDAALYFVIGHQHAERDSVLPIPSVVLSAILCPSSSFFDRCRPYKIPMGTGASAWALYTRDRKICDFRPKSPYISETVRDRPMVDVDH